MGQQVAEPPEDAEQQPHLEQQKHQHQPEAAEDGGRSPSGPFSAAAARRPQTSGRNPGHFLSVPLFSWRLTFSAGSRRTSPLRGVALLRQRLRLAAQAVVVPRIIEPVVVLVVAHQQQTVLVALHPKSVPSASSQWSRCSGTGWKSSVAQKTTGIPSSIYVFKVKAESVYYLNWLVVPCVLTVFSVSMM